MQSILMSINPYWWNLIKSGEKTIEIRKSKPIVKDDEPFKCFIYETEKGFGVGAVVGEFICKKCVLLDYDSIAGGYWGNGDFKYVDYYDDQLKSFKNSRMTKDELMYYSHGRRIYGWFISELKVYEKPIPLNKFYKFRCRDKYKSPEECPNNKYNVATERTQITCSYGNCLIPLSSPPQSWYYVI